MQIRRTLGRRAAPSSFGPVSHDSHFTALARFPKQFAHAGSVFDERLQRRVRNASENASPNGQCIVDKYRGTERVKEGGESHRLWTPRAHIRKLPKFPSDMRQRDCVALVGRFFWCRLAVGDYYDFTLERMWVLVWFPACAEIECSMLRRAHSASSSSNEVSSVTCSALHRNVYFHNFDIPIL